jgi:hypothetical protein
MEIRKKAPSLIATLLMRPLLETRKKERAGNLLSLPERPVVAQGRSPG